MNKQSNRLGVAVAGLGKYGVEEIIPALKETESCYLSALISGDEAKLKALSAEHQVPESNCYTYDNLEALAENPDIDIVYIALPNSLHAPVAIAAAKAGKHIICEKPLAMDKEAAAEIASVVEQQGVRCSIGYRLHFDPYHQELMRLGQQRVFGNIKTITLRNSMEIKDPNAWRLQAELAGGGPLYNNGIYCVQAAIYITGLLPTAVRAWYSDITEPRFTEVEQGVKWEMYFPGGITAICETSFSRNQNLIHVEAEEGWFHLEPAFQYFGLKGSSSAGEISFPEVNQQARQIDDFAECIMENKPSRVPLSMGIRDMEILTAIYQSADSQRKVELTLPTPSADLTK